MAFGGGRYLLARHYKHWVCDSSISDFIGGHIQL
jgi:hypothetical protein